MTGLRRASAPFPRWASSDRSADPRASRSAVAFVATHGHRLYIAFLFALAAVLRMSSLSLMEFRHDSAYWAIEAQRLLDGDGFPLAGQQVGSVSVDLYNGPLMTYVTAAIFAVAGPNPTAVAATIGLASALGVVVTYLLGAEMYSRSAGAIAATLMATAPWMVLYSRMMWPQSFFPLLMPLSLLVLWRAVRNQRAVLFFAYGVLLGLCAQLHLSALALAATGILLILVFARSRIAVGMTVIGGVIGYAPIILNDLLHGFTNLRAMVTLPTLHSDGEPPATHAAKAVWNFSNVLSGQGMWVSKIGTASPIHPAQEWLQGLLFSALFALSFAFVLWRAVVSFRRRKSLQATLPDAILLMTVAFPSLYLLASSSSIQRHYFLFLFPAPFVIMAAAADAWLRSRSGRFGAVAVAGVVVALVVMNALVVLQARSHLESSGGESEYGTVLDDKRAAVSHILSAAPGTVVVDVTRAQEVLPYVHLFSAMTSRVVEVNGATLLIHPQSPAGGAILRYQIVELPYAAGGSETSGDLSFARRGIEVYVERD